MDKRHRHFIEKEVQIVNKHRKICLTSLAIRKMKIIITMRYHYTSIIMT